MNLKQGTCNFRCVSDCAGKCCGGATMITIDEIKKLYSVFPITVGFRKYSPADEGHEAFLEAVGNRSERVFIVGDFIAGNWRRGRCSQLGADNLCKLHADGRKPYQCSIVPFCAVYPEERQDAVFASQREAAFRQCGGYMTYHETEDAVWKSGRFVQPDYAEAFQRFRSGMLRQAGFMRIILAELKKQPVFSSFLRGNGILEAAIPSYLLFDLLDAAGLASGSREDFIRVQRDLCLRELQSSGNHVAVFEDCIVTFKTIQASVRRTGMSDRSVR